MRWLPNCSKLGDVDGVRILGPRENRDRIGTVAFDVDGVLPA